jgi:hypothetical protein
MEWPVLQRCLVFAKHDSIVVVRDVERGALWVDLDHRAVRVATRRHKGAFERAERRALSPYQLGQHSSYVLRLTRRDRYVMDHPNALRYWSWHRRALLCGVAPNWTERSVGVEQPCFLAPGS